MISDSLRRSAQWLALSAAISALGGCAWNKPAITESRSPAALPAGQVAPVDLVDVFETANLGGPLSAFSGMTLVEKIGAWETFTRPSDVLKFQSARLNGISYHFFEKKLYSVHVEVMEKANVQKLVKWSEKTYGSGFRVDVRNFGPKLNRLIIREWSGSRVDFVFKFAENYEGGTMIYVDHKMWEAMDKPRRDKIAGMKRAFEGSWTDLDFD